MSEGKKMLRLTLCLTEENGFTVPVGSEVRSVTADSAIVRALFDNLWNVMVCFLKAAK